MIKVKEVSSDDFFSPGYQRRRAEEGEWEYFDYKYMRDLFQPSTLALFSWNCCGLKAGLYKITKLKYLKT